MKSRKYDCISVLQGIGFSYADAEALRRISMTLHRWHELECGDSNNFASWGIVRGNKTREKLAGGSTRHSFEYVEDGEDAPPYIETHRHDGNSAEYRRIPDREAGALRRLRTIMLRYPTLEFYIQGDPRGASLYILRPGDVPKGESADSYYSRGIVVCK